MQFARCCNTGAQLLLVLASRRQQQLDVFAVFGWRLGFDAWQRLVAFMSAKLRSTNELMLNDSRLSVQCVACKRLQLNTNLFLLLLCTHLFSVFSVFSGCLYFPLALQCYCHVLYSHKDYVVY